MTGSGCTAAINKLVDALQLKSLIQAGKKCVIAMLALLLMRKMPRMGASECQLARIAKSTQRHAGIHDPFIKYSLPEQWAMSQCSPFVAMPSLDTGLRSFPSIGGTLFSTIFLPFIARQEAWSSFENGSLKACPQFKNGAPSTNGLPRFFLLHYVEDRLQ